MIFSLDGVFMEIWLVPYATRMLIVFVLTTRRIYVTSIAIDVFFLKTTPLGSKEMLSERILLWERDLQGVELVRRLLRNWITQKLVMTGSLKDMERSIIGLINYHGLWVVSRVGVLTDVENSGNIRDTRV
jgi:hypothetical protein